MSPRFHVNAVVVRNQNTDLHSPVSTSARYVRNVPQCICPAQLQQHPSKSVFRPGRGLLSARHKCIFVSLRNHSCEKPKNPRRAIELIGSELRMYPEYLLDRAKDRLGIQSTLGPFSRQLAALFVALFGIPEIGTQVRIDNVVRRLPNTVGSLVDIGTGAGMLLEQVRRRREWDKLVGIDLDPASIEIAQRTHPYAALLCVDVAKASSELQHCFDVAVCIDVLEYIPEDDLAKFVDSCAAMLKSGGTLIVHVPKNVQFRHFRKFEAWCDLKALRVGFSDDELHSLLTRCGFSDIQIFPSIGPCASLAWELNMLAAASPLQAVVFPFLLIFAIIGERFASFRNNALLCAARRK